MPRLAGGARAALAVLLVLATAAWTVGCTGARGPATGAPGWRAADCWFAAPAGVEITCGTVVVPESRSREGGTSVALAVAVVHSAAATPADDPVVFLAGGPGSPAIDSALAMLPAFETVLARRDLVVLDQRGTGYSTPSLACAPAEDPAACRARLVDARVDLAAYTTRENAADVADVAAALGLRQVDLLGASYGTRLGLAVLRDHPDLVRSAVLDSVAPVQLTTGPGVARSTASGLGVLFDGCAADPACRERHGDLEAALTAAVRSLDAAPATVDIAGMQAEVDGGDLVAALVSAQYYTEAIPRLPAVIAAAGAGDLEPYARLAARIAEASGGLAISEGMMWSVECAENVPFETAPEFAAAVASLDPAVGEHVVATSLYATGLCELWGVPRVDDRDREPVRSDVPALLLAGEYDPVTPPAWADLAARTLSAAQVQVFPGASHGVFRASPCAREMIGAFLDDPTAPLDAACVAGMGPPAFE